MLEGLVHQRHTSDWNGVAEELGFSKEALERSRESI